MICPAAEGDGQGGPGEGGDALLRDVNDADFVAFDTELTGLDFKRDSIVSIGAVRMRGRRILPGRSFYRLVRPSSELKSQGVVVHGLTHSELEKAASPPAVLREFLDFLGPSILVGHFVFIDLKFLNSALEKYFGKGIDNPVVDTAEIHGWLCDHDSFFSLAHPGEPAKSDLFSTARRHGITLEQAHNALYDAFVSAQLLQRLLPDLRSNGITSVGSLLNLT